MEYKYIDGEKYMLHSTTSSTVSAEKQKSQLKQGGYSVRLIKQDSKILIYRRKL